MDKSPINIAMDKVDDYIIYACITIFAAILILPSENIRYSNISSILYITSLILLFISFLFSLWHRFRNTKRKFLYNLENERIMSNSAAEMADFMEDYYQPRLSFEMNNIQNNNPDLKRDELFKKAVESKRDSAEKHLIIHLENMNYKMKESYNKIFNKPLDEKFGKVFFLIDRFSRKSRYVLFGLGTVSYIISISLPLF